MLPTSTAPRVIRDDQFEWLGTTTRTAGATTRQTREDELARRAYMLASLGYPKKRAQQRLEQNLTWEYDGLGKPVVSKRVGPAVTAAYKRVGPGKR